jgi:inorganic pyrophosphatase/exopolyphosphatase
MPNPSNSTINKEMIEIRLFKKTAYYKAIEQAALLGDDMIVRDPTTGKYDLDSEEG